MSSTRPEFLPPRGQKGPAVAPATSTVRQEFPTPTSTSPPPARHPQRGRGGRGAGGPALSPGGVVCVSTRFAQVLAACTDRSPCGSLQNRLRLHFPRYGRICCILTLLRGNITLKCIHDVTGVGGHSVTSVSSERFVTSLWVCTLCSGKHLGIPHMLVPAAQGLMSAPCLYLARAQVLCQGPWERLSLLNLGFPSLLQFSQEESQLMGTPTLKGKVLLCP